jgi:hypothetical protein
MANHIRGELEVMLGSTAYTVALTMKACAMLEAEFGVENFEDVFTQLGAVCANNGDEADKTTFKPQHANLSRFWSTVLKANGLDGAAFEREVINPFIAAGQAFELLTLTRNVWFAGDAPSEGGVPLGGARVGGTG